MSQVQDAPVASAPSAGSGRIVHVDGLRGLAIAMVVLYHAYSRWPDLYPYGDRFVGNQLVDTRINGVLLFFAISGFVILMSLEASSSFLGFLRRRWLRLFPAMLFASAVVYGLAATVPDWPRGHLLPTNLLPGLTLFGEDAWVNLIGPPIERVTSIEGAFWSLYVEVRFYLVFGGLYFLFGRTGALIGLFGLHFAEGAFRVLEMPAVGVHLAAVVPGLDRFVVSLHLRDTLRLFGTQHYLWFFFGAMYYLWERERREYQWWIAFAVSIVAALTAMPGIGQRLVIVVLFAAAARFDPVRRVVANRFLVFLGFASYPLYLMHENLMVALIVRLGRAAPWLPDVLLPVLPIAVVIGLGWLVARHVEPPLRRVIARGLDGLMAPLRRRLARG
jgi:peptidoglycan/LPS O-acetylase OafA/YrhL